MTEQDAIERVAKAIWNTNDPIIRYEEAEHLHEFRDEARREATAAIAAYNDYLRERATDADVVEAARKAMMTTNTYLREAPIAALTAALDVLLGREKADDR